LVDLDSLVFGVPENLYPKPGRLHAKVNPAECREAW